MPDSDGRYIIAAGPMDGGDRHLISLVEFLVERGHRPIVNQHDHGFFYLAGKRRCWLSRRITWETWQAITERFVLPDNIVLRPGVIADDANEVLIVGWNRVVLDDGLQPVEVWEERGCPEIAAEPEPEDTMVAVQAQARAETAEKDRRDRRRCLVHTALIALLGVLLQAVGGISGQIWVGVGGFLLMVLSSRVVALIYLARPSWDPGRRREVPPTRAAHASDPPTEPQYPDTRRVVQAGLAIYPGTAFLKPVVEFLNQRGHLSLPEHAGWTGGRKTLWLSRVITPADWALSTESSRCRTT